MRYRIEIERAAGNYAAYSPDVPGCVATGATEAECRRNMAEALAFHIEGLLTDGLPMPRPLVAVDSGMDAVEVEIHVAPVSLTA
jgi:predicted RNase H-like HicB family nuclease